MPRFVNSPKVCRGACLVSIGPCGQIKGLLTSMVSGHVFIWGLEEFLRDCGASAWQVKMAQMAPSPRWEFIQKGNHFVYINHNSFCDLREEFEVGGPEYIAVDTRKKERRSRARWVGATLVIDRQ